jgi:hypothetical protein
MRMAINQETSFAMNPHDSFFSENGKLIHQAIKALINPIQIPREAMRDPIGRFFLKNKRLMNNPSKGFKIIIRK